MRRWGAFGLVVLLVAAVAWLLRRDEPRDAAGAAQSRSSRAVARGDASPSSPFGAGEEPRAGAQPGDAERGESASRPLSRAPRAGDGFIEAKVLRAGLPVAAAEVRVYLHAARGVWEIAGTLRTGRDGIARVAARPGRYLVSARAQPSAAASAELTHRAGESVSRAVLTLSEGESISGRTLNAAGDEPAPYVDLELSPATRSRARLRRFVRLAGDAPAEERVRAQSDKEGRFRVTGLSRGAWSLDAKSAGLAATHVDLDVPHAGEVLVRMSAAAFIEGRVVDAQGRPAAAAIAAIGARRTFTTISSAAGAFSVEVNPGSFRLSARLGSQAGAVDRPVSVTAGATARGTEIRLGSGSSIAGSVARASDGTPVGGARIGVSARGGDGESGLGESGPDGTFSVDGLAPGTYDVTVTADGFTPQTLRGVTVLDGQKFPLRVLLDGTGSVQGVVLDSHRAPVADALVDVQPRRFGFGAMGNAPLEARTGPDGRYVLTGAPAGSVSVIARRDGSASGATLPASIREGTAAEVDFELQDDGTVTGHVRTANGAPLAPGVQVRAFPLGQRSAIDPDAAPVDAAGLYQLRLAPGSYALRASSGDDLFSRRGGAQTTIVVAPGQALTQDVVADDSATGFSGTVLEPDGTPSAGARVFARTRGSAAGPQGAITDDGGRFAFPAARADLPPTFDLEADNGGRSGTVTVPQGVADVTVRLSPAASLTGHVTGGSGAPFTVTLGEGGPPFGGNTMRFVGDAFRIDDLSAGQITVHVETDDQRSGDGSATLAPGGTADVSIQLRGATVVSGRVIDASGAPVTQGMIGESGQMAAIGADGRFQLRGLAPGAHQLTLRAGPGRQRTLEVTLTEGQLLDLGDVRVSAQVTPGTIGVGLAGRAPGLFISWTVPGGPADAAGILAGDVLNAVEGVAVPDTTSAASAITGAPGTFVHLSMARNGAPREVSVQRSP